MKSRNTVRAKPRPVTYDYTDASGALLFRTVRFEEDYRPGRVDDRGGWIVWLEDSPPVLFNLPALVEAGGKKTVVIVEDEREAVLLGSMDILSTCSPKKLGPWLLQYSKALSGATVLVIANRDKAGRSHARDVLDSLAGAASQAVSINLDGVPASGGLREWIAAGGNMHNLISNPALAAHADIARSKRVSSRPKRNPSNTPGQPLH